MLSRLWIGFPGVRNLYVESKNTSLRYLEAKLWHIALKWGPFWILSSSGKRCGKSCDIFTNFDGHFVFEFCIGKTRIIAWNGADLESAFPNCVRTNACQILLKNALPSQKFRKWALTIDPVDFTCNQQGTASYVWHNYVQSLKRH